jgi:hypothetical protein
MADTTVLETFVLFLASLGGLFFLLIIAGLSAYAVVYARVPWHNAMFGLIWIGLLTSFACTTVDLSTGDPNLRRAMLITQATIYSIMVALLGFTTYFYMKDDLSARQTYIMMLLPVSLILSVVSLSANTMTKLASC